MNNIDRAKQCFIELAGGKEKKPDVRHLWTEMPRKGLGTLAAEVCEEICPIETSRRSAEGRQLDYVAPSAWHVGCLSLVSWLHQTVYRTPVASLAPLFDSFFAMRAAFRGQTRPWQIRPSQWRRPKEEDITNQRRLKALHAFLTSQMNESDAIELEILGKIEGQADTDAIAQHYEFPTNLVDFTWDPLSALYFACRDSKAKPCLRPGLPSSTVPYAALYSISFLKLASTGRVCVRFPPIQLQRLYRQLGFFVDFGARPTSSDTDPRDCRFADPWMWVEQNCMLVLFPSDGEAAAMRSVLQPRTLLPESKYLEEAVKRMYSIPAASEAECALELQLGLHMRCRPPWRVRELDLSIYTDDEFKSIASTLWNYLMIATMVDVNGRMILDPLIVAKITEWDGRILTAIREIAKLDEYVINAERMIHDALTEYDNVHQHQKSR